MSISGVAERLFGVGSEPGDGLGEELTKVGVLLAIEETEAKDRPLLNDPGKIEGTGVQEAADNPYRASPDRKA